MNLVVDIGNTFIKIGVFDLEELKCKKSCITADFGKVIAEITNSFPNIKNSLVSSKIKGFIYAN